jgi:hypothetical protein
MYSENRVRVTIVLDFGKGVCADPLERVAILEVKGPGPQVGSVSVS